MSVQNSRAFKPQEVDDAILSIDNETKPKRKPKERELTKTHQSWVSNSKDASTLNDLMKTDTGAFDQFANKKSTYKESLYNTTYDINKFTKEQIDHAIQMEKEIMAASAEGNIHVAEERGQILLRDNENEEI